MHEAGDLDDVLVEHPQGVGVGEHQPGDVFVQELFEHLEVNAAARVASHQDRCVARHDNACGIGAVRRVGDEDAPGVAPVRQVMGTDDEQAGELSVGAGRGLQRRAREAGDLGQPALELVHQLERALGQRLRLIRVEAGEALEARGRLVDPRVVLHRAGAERVAAAVHAEVEARQPGEVAHEVDLAHLRQARRRRAARPRRDQLLERRLGNVGRRQAVGPPAAARLLVDGAAVRISHGRPPARRGGRRRLRRTRRSGPGCASP